MDVERTTGDTGGRIPATQVSADQVFVDHRAALRRWRTVLSVVGLVAALVAGLAVVRAVGSGSPEATVRAYFQALADRDLAAALAVTAPELTSGQEELLQPAVLDSPGYLPPTGATVSEASVTGAEAVVPVTYRIDDRAYTRELRLRRADGWRGRVLSRWLLIDALGSLRLGEVPEQLTVNGHPVAAYDPRGPRILPAVPGGYRVAGTPGPVWEVRERQVAVPAQDAAVVDLPLVPTDAVRDELTRQVRQRLDRCADSGELAPPGCPFGQPVRVRPGAEDVRWEITRYPRLRITGETEGGVPVLRVATAQPGEAVVTGRFTGRDGRFESGVSVTVTGTGRISGDTVVFQPDP